MSEGKALTERPASVAVDGLEMSWDYWYRELHDGNCGYSLKIDRVLESTESDYQRIDVIENRTWGKLLVLYGSLMVAEHDQNAYNEMITHVPLFTHPSPKEVLIIGGGDCGALTEAVKHSEVERVTMCELDRKVVEVANRHLPHLATGVSSPKANLVFSDGKAYLEDNETKYDIIILDLSDPIGPAAELFQKSFHQLVYDRLNDDGILVAQSEAPFLHASAIRPMYANLRTIFPLVRMYTCSMPIYPSVLWSFAFCSKTHDPLRDFDRERWKAMASSIGTRYYNDEVHVAAFALPQFVRQLIDS